MAAFLWTVYDHHLLHPDENPELDEERLARLIERLEAHLDGLRVAGQAGQDVAQELFKEYMEAGELFVVKAISSKTAIRIRDLDIDKVRASLNAGLR